MVITNLSILTNSWGLFDIIYFVNFASNGLLINGFSLVIFGILLLIFSIARGGDIIRAMIAASFISFVLSLYPVFSGLMSSYLMFIYIIMFAFGILYLYAIGE